MEKIAKEIGPQLANLVRVAFWTGWRQGELLNLKWAEVDWKAGVLRLRPTSTVAGTTTKNDQGRVFPFGPLPPLEQALRAQRAFTTRSPAVPAPSRSTYSTARESGSANSGPRGRAPVNELGSSSVAIWYSTHSARVRPGTSRRLVCPSTSPCD